ncbi:hypothetical protein [Synechocystis sp. PCC 7509]|uniref:hypothetical protein n=1 Tax=Synechocystis sp. PCC 7509 TaxID=927677 RepID=UPI0002AC39AE|nr:hypothetical protein [Synechocystis sp. PCC 7509]
MNKPINSSKSRLSLQTIVSVALFWGVLALLLTLLFSLPVENSEGVARRAQWYVISAYIFQSVAYLSAIILCFRNMLSPTIISGRSVWLGIGFGLMSYLIGNLILGYWELILQQEPTNVSPADLFFVGAYLFLGGGMISALSARRVHLERWQWGIVAVIAVVGIGIGIWVSNPATGTAVETSAPMWWSGLEKSLLLFYTVTDVLLLIIATMVLLTFWGGRFAQSWRLIAAAVFSLYIGDVWLSYAQNHIENYQSGALLEVFWVFSGVLFTMGAAVEYEVSSRSRREKRGRKRA